MVQLQHMDARLDTLSTELYQVNVRVGRIARRQASMVSLLDLLFRSATLFSVLLCSWLGFLWLKPRTHSSAYTRRLNYAYTGLFMRTHYPT